MILELGLKYRPINQEAARAHSDAVDLLAEDVADIPPHLLEKAIARWVRESKFMPKAADLIRLAREALQTGPGARSQADSYDNAVILANRYNDRLAEQNSLFRWHIGPNNELKLAPINEHQNHAQPLTREELDSLPQDIVSLGLKGGFLEWIGGQLIEARHI